MTQPTLDRTVYVVFAAQVDPSTAESLIATMTRCATAGVETVHLLLSTPGGQVQSGLTVYNVLRGMPFHLITHNAGNVDSIGNAIFLAGDERYAVPHARFMFHGVAQQLQAGAAVDRRRLQELLQGLETDEARIASVISERTNIEMPAAEEMFAREEVKNATDAISLGIIQEIRDINIPMGATVETLVFQR